MGSQQGDVEASLSTIRRLTDTDFAALAWTDEKNQTVHWRHASGNRNDRFKRIVMRPNKGVAGSVIRSGRPLILKSFTPKSGDDPQDYSILLAENLKSAIIVPLTINERVKGVLLVGCRHLRTFDEQSIELVIDFAEQMGAMIQYSIDHAPT
ncbi:GAF domain-containing protein [Effusibacillus dendaii]|uniref:Histidine kinase n=1 Tax=Effusibacillus dendaii TaxID=2743772 RepID=A0A7I8D9X3_9BACL|nr:GAF domain-containing protein [Effusibacillus dendaii]BCJ86885.1 histidine kinase [Effusibacillus dendaii]